MKTEKNILIAFFLNLSFSIFELLGGIFTNSVAILSDSIHDFGDAISIGLSYYLEKKSHNKADDKHTYGYRRYSVLGGLITTVILIVGSTIVIIESINRINNPVEVNYLGMIIFAVFGVLLNFIAAYITREGDSINQKSVNLHMLEDVLGWAIVLVGAVIMNFTDIKIIDPIMSIGVAIFIFINALKNLFQIGNLFLEKTPDGIEISHLKEHLSEIEGVEDIHHLHIWSIDGYNHYATLHVVTHSNDLPTLKAKIREELLEHKIVHSVIETEDTSCGEDECQPTYLEGESSHHHHHH